MPEIKFTQKHIDLARRYNPKSKVRTQKQVIKRKTLRCEIDGYTLKFGTYRVSKTWAIKFAKWILKSFEKYDYEY